MRPLKVLIKAGQEVAYMRGPSDYIRLKSVGAGVSVKVRLLDTGDEVELQEGDDVQLDKAFKEMYVSHDSASDQLIVLMVGYNERATSSRLSGTLVLASPSGIVNSPDYSSFDGGTLLLLFANSARKTVLIANSADSPGKIKIGDATTGAGSGIPVEPGMSISLDTTAAIYIYAPPVGAVFPTVSTLELV